MENKVLLEKLQGIVSKTLDMDASELRCLIGYVVGHLEVDVQFGKEVEGFISVLGRASELASYGGMK